MMSSTGGEEKKKSPMEIKKIAAKAKNLTSGESRSQANELISQMANVKHSGTVTHNINIKASPSVTTELQGALAEQIKSGADDEASGGYYTAGEKVS